MKTISKGEDFEIKIEIVGKDDELLNYQLFNKCNFNLFTTDIKNGVLLTRDDFVEFILHCSSEDLSKLKNGNIQIEYTFALDDVHYPDKSFDKNGIITTSYWLNLGDENNEENNESHCKCCDC
mgnify:CR=1 FL=1